MTGQVALVTGSSRGIGRSAAVALAREGFAVAVHGSSATPQLQSALDAVEAEGVMATAVICDVTDISGFESVLEEVESEIGSLTTLVNNAGVSVMHRGDPLDVTEESWDRCLAINTKSVFFLSQAFARKLLARQHPADVFHSIINITSSNAVAVAEPRLEYAASKAAAAMVSKGWAVRLGREGIAVYDLQPGLIATDMTAGVIDQYRKRAKEGLTLLPCVGQPEDMGAIVATLATGKLPYTTGLSIAADGGMLVPRF